MPEPVSLAEALAALQARCPAIARNATGQAGNRETRYADLPAVHRALFPLLDELELVWSAWPTLLVLNSELKFVLEYELRHVPSGEAKSGIYPLGTGNPQQLGAAVTYARRYALLAATNTVTEGDDDDGRGALETEGDGAATRAEIERWQREPQRGVTRSRQRDDADPWHGPQAAGPGLTPAPDQPGTVTKGQWALMARVLKAAGVESDEASRAECGRRLGREVTSRVGLSSADAKAIIEWKEPASATE
jgi:ERF superfamily